MLCTYIRVYSIIFLYIVRNPNVSVYGPNQATVGSAQVIICTANVVSGIAASLVIFSWRGPGGDLIMNNDRVTISSTMSDGNSHTSNLQFAYIMEGEEGIYTCNVTILRTNATAEGSHRIERLTGEYITFGQ